MVALVAIAALLFGAGIAGAGGDKPRVVTLAGSLAFNKVENQYGCFLSVGVRYAGRKDATSYTIRYTDDGRLAEKTQPPFDDAAEAGYPWGTHFAGLAGFNSSDVRGCPNAEEGYRNRFRVTGVTAVVDLRDATISGRVSIDGRPLSDIPVAATGERSRPSPTAAGPAFGARTDAAGFYRIAIPKSRLGLYTVRADLSGTRYHDASAIVLVTSGRDVTADLEVDEPPATESGAVAAVTEIKPVDRSRPTSAEFLRDGAWSPLLPTTQLRPGERVRTDPNTKVALELDLGGRVGVRPGSEIELSGERTVTDPKRGFRLTKGGVWAKCREMREPLEIQMTGGVIGVKG